MLKYLLFFLFPCILFSGDAVRTTRMQPQTMVYLSLPSSITSALENPENAEKLFASYSYPRNGLIVQLERSIEEEVKLSGEPCAEDLLKRRRIQNLTSKIEFLYLRANSDPGIMKLLLRLNGLSDDLPARADDDVFDLLQPALWNADWRVKANALRFRPEASVKKNNMIKLLIQIQLDMADALYETSGTGAEAKTLAVIEFANIAGVPPPEIGYGVPMDLLPGDAQPRFMETSFPILDLYTALFRLTDWRAY